MTTTKKNVPYLKSFLNEDKERVIRGSKLIYTACSTKQWRAPLGDGQVAKA